MITLCLQNWHVRDVFYSYCGIYKADKYSMNAWTSGLGSTVGGAALYVVVSVVYCDVTERNRVAMSRHRHNVASRHYDRSQRCCYSGVNYSP
jgi:hypothetical protein